jgi:hypothetical protein
MQLTYGNIIRLQHEQKSSAVAFLVRKKRGILPYSPL